MRPKFSQNFLVDKNIAQNIIEGANLSAKDTVIEIGPGRGILTGLISPSVKRLICIEIDRALAEQLKLSFSGRKNTSVINNDFLEWKIPLKTNFKYISNLPYSVAAPILGKILSAKNWTSAVFMLQKEVGERILAVPGTKSYGPLTLLIQFYSTPVKLFNVSRNCFLPVPQVDSMVIKFTKKPIPARIAKLPTKFFKVVRASFMLRRKTILNSLAAGLNLDKTYLQNILSKSGIDPGIRAECLPIDQFFLLTNYLNLPS